MKTNKIKTYVITLSKRFMNGHPKAGEETNFKDAFIAGQCKPLCSDCSIGLPSRCMNAQKVKHTKIHTISANYNLWEKRIKEVQEGKAVLSIRQWSGKPYASKQQEIARLTSEHGVGIQRLDFVSFIGMIINDKAFGDETFKQLANYDGLDLEDWENWFKNYDLSQSLAIIHFTKYRYL